MLAVLSSDGGGTSRQRACAELLADSCEIGRNRGRGLPAAAPHQRGRTKPRTPPSHSHRAARFQRRAQAGAAARWAAHLPTSPASSAVFCRASASIVPMLAGRVRPLMASRPATSREDPAILASCSDLGKHY